MTKRPPVLGEPHNLEQAMDWLNGGPAPIAIPSVPTLPPAVAPAPPHPIETPEHRALLAEALAEHAEEEADPRRAAHAAAAAKEVTAGRPLPYRVGSWGGRPNYECLWCKTAHLSERSAAIHGQTCKYRQKATATQRRPSRTKGGIS